jgi:hypothetical protein
MDKRHRYLGVGNCSKEPTALNDGCAKQLPTKYFQPLQAQIDSNSPGIYDSVIKEGTLEQKAEMVRACQCHDFDLRSVEYFQDCDFSAVDDQGVKGGLNSGDETDCLVALGIAEYDVVFLYAVLQPDPTKRMTVDQILETGYFDVH